MKKLIIIPAFNEEENIISLVKQINKKCSDYDYIIVNDCSTDKTLEICRENKFPVLNLPINLGIGGCMQTGYKFAYNNQYDIAVQVDGDGQHNPTEIKRLEEILLSGNNNIVIGSRFIKKIGFQSSTLRRLGIRFFSSLIKTLTGIIITDPTSGFRICDKNAISFFTDNYPKDYPEPESIVTLIKMGFRVQEVNTSMNERTAGNSSISSIKALYYMIKVTLAILIGALKPIKLRKDVQCNGI